MKTQITPANQDNRDPTQTINAIYSHSGGDEKFEANFSYYMTGTHDANALVDGVGNKPGYTSDYSKADSENSWVNEKGAFFATKYDENFKPEDLVNFLMGTLKKGIGPENIVFPTDGKVSKLFTDSFVTRDALATWYDVNKGRTEFVGITGEMNGNWGNIYSIFENGFLDPETMIGSATVKIAPINSTQVLVTIFNVTSITSGDLEKHLPWNNAPKSVVRDPSCIGSGGCNAYGNISQTYSYTLYIDQSKLK